MTELIFGKTDALEAIRLTDKNGQDWLYASYPKPGGQMRKSTTGFLMHRGQVYPVKPLGRLANALAGSPMVDNPTTNGFRAQFSKLGFQQIDSPADEAESAVERQKRLAEIWERPGQAKFRRTVFELFGARCLITGCENLVALEAAHVLPVSLGGCDEGWNGIPLRADLHRLFDAGVIALDPSTWRITISKEGGLGYFEYDGLDLAPKVSSLEIASQLAEAIRQRSLQ